MSARRKREPRVHLICNAHLDPIWQWGWEEGMTEALATFETAAGLLEEYPEFVFNHNEALLYEWVEEYRPALFARIRALVRAGRWVIAGGWYLQPDCNLSGGESFVRHALVGRNYFRRAFGKTPRVAYNLDSFGHHGNLPQILRKCGYQCYVHFRPRADRFKLDDHIYRWRGIDGSEITAVRAPCGWYNTHDETELATKVEAMVALSRELGRDVTVFWGAGDHGGGATRRDIQTVRRMRKSLPQVTHGDLEDYWKQVRGLAAGAPVVSGELQKAFTGCYTSVIGTKQRNRRGEGLVLAAERAAALAWWLFDERYPREKLDRAWRRVLFNQFHDILPGSSVREGYRDSIELYGEGLTLAREVLVSAQMRMLRRRRRRQPLPLCIFNHQGRAVCRPVEFEFMGATSSLLLAGKTVRVTGPKGAPVAAQVLSPQPRMGRPWRMRMMVEAELPAAGLAEYRIHVEEGKPARSRAGVARRRNGSGMSFRNRFYSVTFNTRTGLIESLRDLRGGGRLLAGPGGAIEVREDSPHAWGQHTRPYGRVLGRFKPPSRRDLAELVGSGDRSGPGPVRVIEEGPLCTILEVVQTFGRSVARLRYTMTAGHPDIRIDLLLDWSERCRVAQLAFPTALDAPDYRVEIPHGDLLRAADGDESPCGRWVCLGSRDRRLALALVNDGTGGVEVGGGLLRQTLVRSPEFCTMAAEPRTDRVAEFMDVGEHQYRFLLRFGASNAVLKDLPALAEELSMPPGVHVHLPPGPDREEGLAPGKDAVRIGSDSVRLAALKRSEDGRALVARLVETRGRRRTETTFRVSGGPPSKKLVFSAYEIKTLRLSRRNPKSGWVECDLLENG